jgi:hypothetical protein
MIGLREVYEAGVAATTGVILGANLVNIKSSPNFSGSRSRYYYLAVVSGIKSLIYGLTWPLSISYIFYDFAFDKEAIPDHFVPLSSTCYL